MSHKPAHPEKNDHVLMEMVMHDLKAESPETDKKNLNGATQMGWSGSSVSPYRAAYIKSHILSIRSDVPQTSGNLLE